MELVGPSPLLAAGYLSVLFDQEVDVMYQRIIVPVDGSARSWDVADAAAELAVRWDCPVEVVSIVRFDSARDETEAEINGRIADSSWADRATSRVLAGIDESVGEYIASIANEHPGSLVVMSTTGHGRSAAILGSTAEEILRHTTTPILLYGPVADAVAPSGTSLMVAVDGSELSEQALGLAGAWAIGLDLVPWVVTVGAVGVKLPADVTESAGPYALAAELRDLIGRTVQFETLHGKRPAVALTEFAESMDAAALVETTHARRGLDRLVAGSVTMSTVRHSHIPVLVVRGLEPGKEAQKDHSGH